MPPDSYLTAMTMQFQVLLGAYMGSPGGSVVKNLPANAGDLGLIPGSGRSPGMENGSILPVFSRRILQYSSLGNPTDRGAWWVTVHGTAKELDMT